jgi:hypothetical protein
MRRPLIVLGLILLATPVSVHGWGYEAHKFIVARAIPLLPPELRPLFEANRTTLIEHSLDPDLWRNIVGEKEDPHHYLDLDWEGYGPYPYAALPRNLEEAFKKFGKEQVERNGTVPWRTEEMYGKLKDAFAAYERRGSFGRFDILFYAAWLAHYVSDAYVPLHAVVNHDGQLTGQRGVHTRWEALLFERYVRQLELSPKPIPPVSSPRDFIFTAVLQGTQLAPMVLEADRVAIGTRDVYDDAYYAAFFKAGKAIMERRVDESTAAVAAMIAGAWEAAGKPPVPVRARDTDQRRRP